jgi:hypothetical protein
MAFKSLYMAHAPDADHKIHRSEINTGRSRLFTVAVSSQEEAVEVSMKIDEEVGLDAVVLCPGFSHADVAEIFHSLGGKVSVSVSRGDGPSGRISQPAIQREYFDRQHD